MIGSEIRPIEMTDAATTPVVAASRAPTKITANGEAAPHRAEQLADRVQEVFRHAGAFEHETHEGEERDREKRLVVHHAVDALGHRGEQRPVEHDRAARQRREFDADDEEQQADGGEREGHRVTQQQEEDERREHDRREVLCDEGHHSGACAPPRG